MNPALRAALHGFSDFDLGDGSALEGLALCQHIERQHCHVGGHSPVRVRVRVSAQHSELDRARGAFAGFDHYLAKPAAVEALHPLLSQHRSGPAPRASRQ